MVVATQLARIAPTTLVVVRDVVRPLAETLGVATLAPALPAEPNESRERALPAPLPRGPSDERGKAEAGLRSEAALRALGDDRDMTEEQLAPLARVHGDAADRAVVDGRRGHGRSLEKVPGKLGHVERGAPEVIVPGNRRRWELLTGVKWVVAGSWHLMDR